MFITGRKASFLLNARFLAESATSAESAPKDHKAGEMPKRLSHARHSSADEAVKADEIGREGCPRDKRLSSTNIKSLPRVVFGSINRKLLQRDLFMKKRDHGPRPSSDILREAHERIADLERQLAEQKRRVDEMRRNDERARALVDGAPEWIWEVDARFRFVYSNAWVRNVLGYPPKDMLGRSLIDWMASAHDLDENALRDSLRLPPGGAFLVREDEFLHQDGSIRCLETFWSGVYDDAGRLVGYRGRSHDVSRYKEIERSLQKSEERFELVLQAANDAIYDWDIAAGTVWLSESHRAILGFPGQGDNYLWWKSRLHPSDRDRILVNLRAVLKGVSSVWMEEYKFLCQDGRYIDVIDRGQIIRDENGRPLRIVGSMMDVTARKLAEQTVRKSEEDYRRLIEDLPIGMVVRSPKGTVLISNAIARQYAGVFQDQDEHPDHRKERFEYLREDGSVLPPEDYPSNLVISKKAIVRNMVYGVIHPADREIRWFLTSAQPQWDESGNLARVIISLIDVTDRKKAEDALEKSEAKYRFLTEGMSDIVWTMDRTLTFTYLSPSVEAALGMTPEEALERGTANIMTEDSMARARQAVADLLSSHGGHPGEPVKTGHFEAAYRHRNGSIVWLENVIRPVMDGQGEVIGIHGVARNITEIREAAIERERLIEQLKKALADVKVLSGMLPICASCKKIRDDKGYWQQIESYLSEHSDALFSHSLCPECARKLYPGYPLKKAPSS